MYEGFSNGLVVKNPPAMQEMEERWVRSLGLENPLQEGMATPLQYSCLGNPPGQRSLVGYSPWGHKELEQLSTYTQGSMKHFTDLDLELLTGYKVYIYPGTFYEESVCKSKPVLGKTLMEGRVSSQNQLTCGLSSQ